jgi:hypothetical protein
LRAAPRALAIYEAATCPEYRVDPRQTCHTVLVRLPETAPPAVLVTIMLHASSELISDGPNTLRWAVVSIRREVVVEVPPGSDVPTAIAAALGTARPFTSLGRPAVGWTAMPGSRDLPTSP